MRNIVRILRRDVMRLARVPAAWVIILGLTVLPAFYAWVNVLGFWDPYANTAGVRVAVANEDRGAGDDTLGEVDLGATIVDSLRGNGELGWTFVDRDEAMHQVRAGDAYAAIVIPEDFSERLVAVIHGDLADGRPQLDYYVNEKVSPIAPKVTDTAATTVDRQVNAAFVSAASEAVTQAVNRLGGQAGRLAAQTTDDARTALERADDGIATARARIAGFIGDDADGGTGNSTGDAGAADGATGDATAADTLQRARDTLQSLSRLGGDASTALTAASGLLADTQTGLNDFATSSSTALATGESLLAQAAHQATGTLSGLSAAVVTANGQVAGSLATLRDMNGRNAALIDDLNALAASLPDGGDGVTQAIDALRDANTTLGGTIDDLDTLNAGIATTATDTGTLADDLGDAADTALKTAADARTGLTGGALPQLGGGLGSLAVAAGTIGGQLTAQGTLTDQALLIVDQLDQALDQADTALRDTDEALAGVQSRLATLRTDLDALASASTLSSLFGGDGLDVDAIATFMTAPAVLDERVVYPVDSYGSGMAPLFTNLAMWAGAFMLIALLRLETDGEGIDGMTATQAYLGRWLLLALLAAAQGLIVTVGDLTIGVQTANAAVFVLTGAIAAVTYSAIAYMLAVTLQHVGKALVMAMIIVQIPGAGGMYPIEMMPGFFRALHPFFPFTYAIDAMRETIGGFYGDAWVTAVLHLLVFAAVSFAIGIVVRPLMADANRAFTRRVAETGILNGEPVTDAWPSWIATHARVARRRHAAGKERP